MEENVALDSKKQRKFVKSIRGIKKLIKKNAKSESQKKDEKVEPQKPFSMKLKDGKIKKRKRKPRGLVYLSHIPHGFYEHQMTQYFKQFGVVTNVRVIRSKRTGNSKGFAFVEFREPAVGQIVAETMNNYLMGKRLIKAAYIPPEKQKYALRKHWNSVNNPGSQLRLKMKKAFNAVKDEDGELKRVTKLMSNLTRTRKKLSDLGIDYDFFTPVDVPEALLHHIIKKEVVDDNKDKVTMASKAVEDNKDIQIVVSKPTEDNKGKEQPKGKKIAKKEKLQSAKQSKETTDKQNNDKESKITEQNKKSKPIAPVKDNMKQNKKEKQLAKANKIQQKEKEQKLKMAGVKPPEFIKIAPNSGDESDSSCDFDSDEYEKMLEEDNSDLPSDESEESDEDDEVNEEESVEEEIPPKKVKGKTNPKLVQQVQTKKQKQQPQEKNKVPVEGKRKIPQKPAVSPKKPKFEKQNQKNQKTPIKKQFKKK